jgi:hypothetical protein
MASYSEAKTKFARQVRKLVVNDVLRASWGYDQTNIDYFLITKLVGKASVEVVEIGQQSDPTGNMSGVCVPDINKRKGEPMIRRVDGEAVRINECVRAYKADYQLIGEVKVFKPDNYSSYH